MKKTGQECEIGYSFAFFMHRSYCRNKNRLLVPASGIHWGSDDGTNHTKAAAPRSSAGESGAMERSLAKLRSNIMHYWKREMK